jgi:type II secretory pathway pseudopilin PulG
MRTGPDRMRPPGATPPPTPARHRRRGMTLMEILFSVLIIFLLMGILLISLRAATKYGQASADRRTVSGLRIGVETFVREFGFLPPLVKDNLAGAGSGPLDSSNEWPLVYDPANATDEAFLQGEGLAGNAPDARFSIYSLAYYLVGALDTPSPDGHPIDGVLGPGFRAPTRDGRFPHTGRKIGSMYDPGRSSPGIAAVDRDEGRFELRDRKDVPIRYYSWLPDRGVLGSQDLAKFANVPALVGDPLRDPKVRGARWAIVAAGPNGLVGDEWLYPPGHRLHVSEADAKTRLGLAADASTAALERAAKEDNIVETGERAP